MSLFETEGIILKTYSLNDADKIVLFLTEKHGLIRGAAKGAKRLKSRFGGGLEPFTVVDISYYQKEERELVSIRAIELVKSYFDVISDPYILQNFSYLIDLTVEFAPPHDPNEKLYRMVKICLENAAGAPESLNIITLYFEFWLLRLGGYLPNWERCDVCKRLLNETEAAFLQTDFHLYCAVCRKSKAQNAVDAGQRFIYKTAQKYAPEEFIRLTANRFDSVAGLSETLKKMLSRVLNREITGKKILMARS
jgi:DNA repair protein RecO (recombination protein O)